MNPRRLLPLLVLLLAALPAPAGAARGANAKSCPARKGTMAKDSTGRLWHHGQSLYACTTVYGRAPRVRRLGPWTPQTKVAWDGSDAVWSVRLTRGHVSADRIYAADAEDGTRWLLGTRLIPNSENGVAAEGLVQRVFAWGATAGWVTKGGAVVFALRSPEDDPVGIGLEGFGPFADDHLTLIGVWSGADPAQLASSAKIDSSGGDGDECGGSEDYRMTVVPDAASGARVGISWFGGWSRPFCG